MLLLAQSETLGMLVSMMTYDLVNSYQGFVTYFENEVNDIDIETLSDCAGMYVEMEVYGELLPSDGLSILNQLGCETSDPPMWFIEYSRDRQEDPLGYYNELRDDIVDEFSPKELPRALGSLFLECWLENQYWRDAKLRN